MALTESTIIPSGITAPDFSLPAVDGKIYALADFSGKSFLAVVFMCNHCPYIQACLDRLIQLQKDYEDRGVQFVGINANDSTDYPEDSFDAMKIFAQEKGINFPYLHDDFQDVAKAYGAVCTPDLFVYDKDRRLVYHGRIDDNWKDASRVTCHDLRDALDALLNNQKPSEQQHPSMGCSIKWKA